MDRQAAYDLFLSHLGKLGLAGNDLKKELPGLIAWGYSEGCFTNPHTIHELSMWRKVGQELWDAVQTGSKEAKSLAKIYRAVRLIMEQLHGEARVAAAMHAAVKDTVSSTDSSVKVVDDNSTPVNAKSQNLPKQSSLACPTLADKIAWGLDKDLPPWTPDQEKQTLPADLNLPAKEAEKKELGKEPMYCVSDYIHNNLNPFHAPFNSSSHPTTSPVEAMDTDNPFSKIPPLPPDDDNLYSSDDESNSPGKKTSAASENLYSGLRRDLQQQQQAMTSLLDQMQAGLLPPPIPRRYHTPFGRAASSCCKVFSS